jgi:hypothetical protein
MNFRKILSQAQAQIVASWAPSQPGGAVACHRRCGRAGHGAVVERPSRRYEIRAQIQEGEEDREEGG